LDYSRSTRRCSNAASFALAGAFSICVALASWQSASATADGPDYYAVVDVAVNDTLSLHAGPSIDSEKIGEIAHDARGLRNLGCRGLPSFTEWQGMTDAERETSRLNSWCKVRYLGIDGWVPGRFLREDGSD
jgi:hypothetical protein